MRFVRLLGLMTVLVIGWLIGWSNSDPVLFSFLDWQAPSMPAYVVYCIFLTTGLLIGLILGRFIARR